MFISKYLVTLAILAATHAAPLEKRIAQTIADSTAKWEQACLAAGGGQQCNPQSQASFSTLLAAAGPCDQQNQGDAMIDLAKQLNNDPDMITLTQIFVQQPRNSPDSLSVPYCEQAPKNAELNGLFQCQFQGANLALFTGNVAVGGAGTIPFEQSSPLSPPGSCPANPAGPIAAGSQLTDITNDPGVGESTSSSSSTSSVASASSAASSSDATVASSSSAAASSASSSASKSTNGAHEHKGHEPSRHHLRAAFTLQNGLDAQQLNAQFETLTTASPCTDGTSACVNGQFAQCSGGKFALSSCSSGLQCVALPLVNSAGTSITCDTLADAEARITATGATGGLTGTGSAQAAPAAEIPAANASPSAPAAATTTTASSSTTGATKSTGSHGESPKHSNHGDSKHHRRAAFTLQNGLDAQTLNAEFETLTTSSACTDGTSACVNGQFAQCSGGKFALSSCSAGLQCVALPLVNSAGTSITCDTLSDAEARIAATGATGGLTGSGATPSTSEVTSSVAPASASSSSSKVVNSNGSGDREASNHKAHGSQKHF
ncbi:hypothetical protein SCHPADRAFT_38915 [Schizopora paradoxa]|uniref:Carbohydrate-binding module family 19 domain-containing protein n=1 Tax=Schizopora paradoxa TaxID=27342 RepID=A0A0H2ST26_9AGAM|nr:hypothetical protein SCHPADRAFT_38915 [Schizopora paradoxa]